MTKEEWQKVEHALSGVYGRVKLKADGREVVFHRGQLKKNRLGIIVLVDGEIRWEAREPKNDHPDSRYWRPSSRHLWTDSSRREMKKMTKRALKRLGYDPDEKRHYFRPDWPNATAIRRHYQKTFQHIELMEVCG